MSLLSELVNWWIFIVCVQHSSQFRDGTSGLALVFLHHPFHSFFNFVLNAAVSEPADGAAFYFFEHFAVFLLDAFDVSVEIVYLGPHVLELELFLLDAQLIRLFLQNLLYEAASVLSDCLEILGLSENCGTCYCILFYNF